MKEKLATPNDSFNQCMNDKHRLIQSFSKFLKTKVASREKVVFLDAATTQQQYVTTLRIKR